MKPTRDELEARWKDLWAIGEELKQRRARLDGAAPTMEEAMGDRAWQQLRQDREQHERDLLELRRQMQEHGGFDQ